MGYSDPCNAANSDCTDVWFTKNVNGCPNAIVTCIMRFQHETRLENIRRYIHNYCDRAPELNLIAIYGGINNVLLDGENKLSEAGGVKWHSLATIYKKTYSFYELRYKISTEQNH